MKTYAALVATMVFWGLSFVATKVALESVPTFTMVFIRFSLAALFFLVIRQGRKWPVFHGRDRLKMVLLALFEPGLYFIFETIGLQYTTAPKTALIIATQIRKPKSAMGLKWESSSNTNPTQIATLVKMMAGPLM